MLKQVMRGMPEGYGEHVDFAVDPWEDLYEAFGSGGVRQAKVSGIEEVEVDGRREARLVLFFGPVKGVIPESEVGEPRPRKLGALVGTEVAFKVVRCDRKEGIAYLSRRAALEEMSAATWQELRRDCEELVKVQARLKEIFEASGGGELTPEAREEVRALLARAREVGPVRPCTVKVVVKDGAFVDIGGVSAYLPAREVSWGHVDDVRRVLKPGQSFSVRVIRVDFEGMSVRVSLRALLPDPWANVEGRYVRGGVYSGTVVRHTSKGNVLVELEPGVEVVCERLPLQKLKPGDRVKVKVGRIDVGRRFMRGYIVGSPVWAS